MTLHNGSPLFVFGQTFSLLDLPLLFFVVFLEGILSIDNALSIALITRRLTEQQRKKALTFGMISGFFLRSCAIFSISYLLHLFWIQCIGGIYLLYLCFSFLKGRKEDPPPLSLTHSFFMTLVLVEWTDLVFAMDSILVTLALIDIPLKHEGVPPKIWIVYFGGLVGMILMRLAAFSIQPLLDRFPQLHLSAHLLIGWIGLKLIVEGAMRSFPSGPILLPHFGEVIFWVVSLLLFLPGCFRKKNKNTL